MPKSLMIAILVLLSAGMLLPTTARAQQTPASSAQPAAASQAQQTPPTKPAPAPAAQQPAPADASNVSGLTPQAKLGYALGMNLGNALRIQSVEIDPDMLLRGLKDVLAGGKTLLTEDQVRALLSELQNEVRQKQQDRAKLAAENNAKEGQAFLAANKTKEGIVALPSGLQYKILTGSSGPKPNAGDTVTCNYRGTLIDGTEFDSSYKRGQPVSFPVSQVIKGWTEALQLMPVGSKWQLFIPSDLAYGERGGGGGSIGPNATLIFEVELVSIKGKTEPAQPTAATPAATPKPQ